VDFGTDEHDMQRHAAYDRRMRRLPILLVLLVVFPIYAGKRRVSDKPAPTPTTTGGPTFNKEVVRIFQQHCQSCHHPGDIAPFSLTSYADAKQRAFLIRAMTQSRQMPPWKATPGCGEFEAARVMPQSDIDTIAQWVANGAPEGNAADAPPPLVFDTGWTLGQPDLVLKSPEPYTPPASGDMYRCFTIPTNTTSERWVEAIDVHPGDRESVHHVIAYIDTTGESQRLDEADPGPGYTSFGGPGFSNPGTLGGWAPGARPITLPANVGMSLPANSRIVLQVHYHPHHGAPEPDQTEIGIYYSKTKPARQLYILPLINQNFTIPPNDPNFKVTAQFPILTPVPMTVHVIAPHMHYIGRKMHVETTHLATGNTQCLINIDDWDFHWQGMYRYKQPVKIPAGSRVSLTAYYDNSSANPRNPNDPPKPVSWGEATTDEMCIAFLGVTLD
jgi:hypothetical protein